MVVKATLLGFLAILMWSFLATMTAFSGKVPPFLLTALTFFIASTTGLIGFSRKNFWHDLKQPLSVWFVGVCGLFGYHFFFFTALRHSSPIEASLINYLWPLLVVLGSALMPNERLHWFHIFGALLAFLGMVSILSPSGMFGFHWDHIYGNSAALFAAITWAAYSLLTRRFAYVPTTIVTGFCFITACLSFICHFLFSEDWILPQTTLQWLGVVGLGVCPVGLAFYCWDFAVKHGNIQVIGVASYAAPLISTSLLVMTGLTTLNWNIAVACIFITCGALLATSNRLIRRKRKLS